MLSSPDWTWWLTTALLSVCALALLIFALFNDQARSRKRCPRCWYPMDAATSLQCPECGHTARTPRHLLRTRRRWRLVAVALLIACAAGATALGPKIRRDGWRSIIPATALVTIWPIPADVWIARHIDSTPTSDPNVDELDRRIATKSLSRWQINRWMLRVEAELLRTNRLYSPEERTVVSKLTRARITRNWKNATLETVLADIEHDLSVPVRADWNALQPGPGKDTTLSLELTRATGEEAISEVLLATGWDYVSFGDWFATRAGVLLTSSAGPAMPPRVALFDASPIISQLCRLNGHAPSSRSTAHYAELLQILCTHRWNRSDPLGRTGRSTISTTGHVLIATASAPDLDRIQRLLDALLISLADGPPLAVSLDPEEWTEAITVVECLKRTPIHAQPGQTDPGPVLQLVKQATGIPVDETWIPPVMVVFAGTTGAPPSAFDLLTTSFPRSDDWDIEHGAIRFRPPADEVWKTHARLYRLDDLLRLEKHNASLRRLQSVLKNLRGSGTVPRSIDIIGDTDPGYFGDRVLVQTTVIGHLEFEAAIQARLQQPKPITGSPTTPP